MKNLIFDLLKYAMGGALLALIFYLAYFFLHPGKKEDQTEQTKDRPGTTQVK